MLISDLEEPLKIFLWIGTALDGEKIDDLNEELRLTVARFADGFDESLQSRKESIMTDAQQRATGNISYAGRFNYQSRGPAGREPAIPVEIILSHESIFGGAPGDHRGDPGATR